LRFDLNAFFETYISLERCLNIGSTVGIALLAVPAFSLNFRKKTLSRIEGITQRQSQSGRESALRDIATELKQSAESNVTNWRRIDEICLWCGYVLLLGSAIARALT
jgi:hypothetical protein